MNKKEFTENITNFINDYVVFETYENADKLLAEHIERVLGDEGQFLFTPMHLDIGRPNSSYRFIISTILDDGPANLQWEITQKPVILEELNKENNNS